MSASRVKAALTRKLGPFPAWAWLAAFAVAAYVYEKRKGSTTPAPATAADTQGIGSTDGGGIGTPTGGSSGGASDGGGGSSGGDNPVPLPPEPASSSTTPPTTTIIVEPAGPTTSSTTGPTDTTTTPAAKTRAGKLSQPIAGLHTPLVWGGKRFTSQAEFQAWAKAHGTSAAAIFTKHPEAAAIFGQLSKPAPRVVRKTPATPRATRQPTRPAAPAARQEVKAAPAKVRPKIVERPPATRLPARATGGRRPVAA